MSRKPLSKSTRFEVFKRDKFTCQYCGASAPEVILEVDHITPVSKGGTDDIMNLVTSCRDCNRGKRDKKLSDTSAVMIQKHQLDAIQERREQLEMMVQWRKALEEEREIEADAIESYFSMNACCGFTDKGRRDVKKLIKEFGFNEVYTACEIAIARYYQGTQDSKETAFKKIGGICFNRKKAGMKDAEQDH